MNDLFLYNMANDNVRVTISYITEKMEEFIEIALLNINLLPENVDDFLNKNYFYINRSAKAMHDDYYNNDELNVLHPNNNPPNELFYEYYNDDLLRALEEI